MRPIVAYCFIDDEFSKVICNKGTIEHDYWYFWEDDCEPVRVTYDGDRIIQEMHRFHWMHRINKNPFNDDKNRIQVFFWLSFHTPQVKSEGDRIFDALTTIFQIKSEDEYDLANEEVPSYYVERGEKGRHPPKVYYKGWEKPL